MKRYLARYSMTLSMLILLIGITLIPRYVLAADPSGSGTQSDPYIISTAEDLQWMSSNILAIKSKYFKQINDIDMSGIAFTPIGTQANMFQGTYDGCGRKISNLTINTATVDFVGLFGYISQATITNVDIVNANIKTTYPNTAGAGGIAGWSGGATVKYCSVSGTVESTSATSSVGGVVGSNSGNIENCHSTAILTANGNGAQVGGITSYLGSSSGCVKYSYFAGSFAGTATTLRGGIVGNFYSGTVENNYFLNTATTNGTAGAISGNTGAVPITAENLKQTLTYTNWDTAFWYFNNSVAYPTLKAPAPYASDIAISGSLGGADSKVTVSQRVPGEKVSAYSAESGGVLLGSGTVLAGQTSVEVGIGDLTAPNGSVYVVANTAYRPMEGTRQKVTYIIPAAPTGLTATSGYKQSQLSWSAVSGATSYKIYKGTESGSYTYDSTVTTNSAIVSGLANGTTYYFVVSACTGFESGYSAEATAKPSFSPPTDILSSIDDGTVTLFWSGLTGISSYKVYYGDASGTYTNSVTVTDTTAIITGLTNNTTYYFAIKSLYNTDESAYSNEVTAIPKTFVFSIPVYVPFAVSSMPTGWESKNIDTTTYDTKLEWSVISTGGGDLPALAPYSGSYMLLGNSYDALSGSSARFQMKDNLSLPTQGSYEFSFYLYICPDDYGAEYADNNIVPQISEDGGATWIDLGDKIYTQQSSNNGWKKYPYSLDAYKGKNIRLGILGTSDYGYNIYIDDIKVTEVPTVPTAPANVTATAGDTEATVSFYVPSYNGGSPITQYTVTPYIGTTAQTSLITTGTASPIRVAGLTNGTEYAFTVYATNSIGNSPQSLASNKVIPEVKNPEITGISVPANMTYKLGDTLSFSVSFNRAVNVNYASGNKPYIDIELGTETKRAYYQSGTGSSAIVFGYTITAGDQDSDGIILVSPINLNGATIKDSVPFDAILTFTPPTITGVLVDGIIPTLSEVTIVSNNAKDTGKAKTGDIITIDITASEDLTQPMVTIAGQTATVNDAGDSDSKTWKATYTMQSSNGEGTVAFIINYSDAAGNSGTAVVSTTNSSSIIYDKTAPSGYTTEFGTVINNTNQDKVAFSIKNATIGTTYSYEITSSGGAGSVAGNGAVSAATQIISNVDVSLLADGTLTLKVKLTDEVGNTGSTATATIEKDTAAPDTTITSNPAKVTVSTTAIFDFISEAGAVFEASLDGGAYVASTRPQTYTGLSEGEHTFTVRAIDAVGNADASPASYSWTVDTTAPDTTITSKPTIITNLTSAIFGFTSTEGSGSFEGSIDGGTYTVITNPVSFSTLAEGEHTFSVRAIDAVGNVDATPASYTWTIDTTAPDTAITSKPETITTSATANFGFTSEAGAVFETSLDGGAYVVSANPQTYTGLGDGEHTFSVRAIDTAGNVDATPISYTWTIDTAAPDTTITSKPAAIMTSTTATFEFSSEAGAVFETSLDGGAYAASTNSQTYTGLSDGAHTFTVRAIDTAGNVDASPASYSWKVDTTVPNTTITSGPAIKTNTTSAIFGFTSSEGSVTFEGRIDGGAYATITSPASFSGLLDGEHTFLVRAIDEVGNVDATPASYTWTIDTTAPDTTITSKPATITTSTTAKFEFTSEAGAIFEASLDGGAYAASTNPQTYTGLSEGVHTFTVRAIDAMGNVDATPVSFSWTIDTTAPTGGTISINNGAQYTNKTNAALTLFATDAAEMMVSEKSDFSDVAAFEEYTTSKSISLSSGDGVKTIYVRYKDAAGNLTTADISAAIELDTQAPTTGAVTINGGAQYTKTTSITLNLSVSDAAYMKISENSSYTGAVYEDYAASRNFSLSEGNGTKTVYVKFMDVAGNETDPIVSNSIILDTTAPSAAISEPSTAVTSVNDVTYTIIYTGADTVSLKDTDITLNKTGTVSAAVYSTGTGNTRTVVVSGIAGEGTAWVSIAAGTAMDNAGNLAAPFISKPFTVDNTAPTLTISAPSSALTANSDVTYTVNYIGADTITLTDADITVNKSGTVSASVYATGTGNSRTVVVSGISGDGTLGISLAADTASDKAGNRVLSSEPTATFAVDNTAPTGTVKIYNDADYMLSNYITLNITSTDGNGSGVSQTRFSINDGAWSPWVAADSEVSSTVNVPYGLVTAKIQLKDKAGNISSGLISDSIVYKSIPVANTVTKQGMEDTTLRLTVTDFVYNNSDGNGLSKIRITSLPSNGTLMLGNAEITQQPQEINVSDIGSLAFVPDQNWNGSTTLRWMGFDGTVWTDSEAAININIIAVNDEPVAESANYSTDVDVPMSGVLKASDIDTGDILTYAIVSQGSKGTFTIISSNSGAFTYVPGTGNTGIDTVTFKVYDSSQYSSTGSININILSAGVADLSNIRLSAGSLSPLFNKNTLSYAAKVNNATDNITVTASVYNKYSTLKIGGELVTVSNSVYEAAKTIDLKVGINIITVEVFAQDISMSKTYTLTITREEPKSHTTTNPETDTKAGTDILVNGKTENAGTSTTTTNATGQTVTTIAIDQNKIEQKLAQEGNNSVVTIPVNTKSEVVVGELTGQLVKAMETKSAVLEIKTETATYTLPAKQINIDAISSQLGTKVELKDIKVSVEISAASAEKVKIVESSAKAGEFTVLATPVEFNIKCTSGGQTVNVATFNAYVERTIAIPEGVDPNKVTTGVVIEPDGTVRHVPTKVVMINGKYYAKINSLTNSTYSVVWHPYEFKDLNGHWAKTDINDMGSRMVIGGVGNDRYEPDRDITRAEFAAIVVKALGLKAGTGSNPFADVAADQWYADYIKTAYSYKIISGYDGKNFGPSDKITREQAMAMITRAMNITGLKVELGIGEADSLLKAFSDGAQASDYAKDSMAVCIKSGLVTGRENGMIAPAESITRAEVAVLVRRLLKKSDLI